MGQLLKEVLKTLCGVNQWSYAVFWKIGCQNTKLLIWEECYFESNCSAVVEKSQLPFEDWEKYWATDAQSQLRLQAGNAVQVLVNKMMMNNQVNLVGQGIVGRAAFTGNHEWILAKNYTADAHPPEVLVEIRDQFSGGMQTVAVIPTPHGVVQFGSSLTIMENMGFVNNVKGLILQLGCVPGALLSDNIMKESTERIGVPVSFGMHDSMSVPLSSYEAMKSSQLGANSGTSTSQPSHSQARLIQDNIQSTASAFCTLNLENTFLGSCGPLSEPIMMPNMTPDCSFQGQLKNETFKIPPTSDAWMNKVVPSWCNSSTLGHQSVIGQPGVRNSILTSLEQQVLRDTGPKKEKKDELKSLDENFPGSFASGGQSINVTSLNYEDPCNQPLFGDDLYDVLGADFKKRLFDSKLQSSILEEPITKSQGDRGTSKTFPFAQETNADLFSDCSFFTSMDCDQLLDAVVSRPQQSSGENVSCKKALAKTCGSSAPSVSPSYCLVGLSDPVQKDIPSCFEKLGIKTSSSLTSGCSKNDTGSCSQTTSIYGSQLSSWVSSTMRPESSGSTAYSKRTDEKGKQNRKRLKPGENPRPRPKDRQMIQDRVKELREIVPNGAKCSIDALLERTIKHMLFLQSVTKHADKLKQAGEPKIIDKEGGLLLKDNFEGGATWAFEVGSQSMACPIIVEDLNSPRQMLVEMLCEERGFFLEIADLIRGLGLTILKGVMEARNDKIWARFAVEANRDVTRMEVFMSLVRLMEQTVKGGSSNNLMVQHSFPQAASIPATGSLQ